MTRACARRALLVALALAAPALALPTPRAPIFARPGGGAPSRSLASRVGVAAVEPALAAADADERRRAVTRLAALGDVGASERIARAFDEPALARDLRARLVGLRGVAPHAALEVVRPFVARSLALEAPSGSLGALVRDTAALLLARAADPKCVEVLASTARRGGAPGEAALRAAREQGVALPGGPPADPPVAAVATTLASRVLAAEQAPDDAARERAVAAVADDGSASAVRTLAAWLGDDRLRTPAAAGRARVPARAARDALARALGQDTSRRLAARASIARAVALSDAPSSLAHALAAMARSADASDRATAALGAVALGLGPTGAWIASPDDRVGQAAARASWLSAEGPRACAARLARDPSPTWRAACASALEGDDVDVGAATLASWALAGGPAAPLAAGALARRGGADARRDVEALLRAPDPHVRAATGSGLARSDAPAATALLAAAWAFEPDASVRRALLDALARRSGDEAGSTLRSAAALDPDAACRDLARRALRGPADGAPEASSRVGFVLVDARAGARVGRVVDASGRVVPVVTDPDGVLLVVGLAPGQALLDLAFPAGEDDASGP